MNNKICHQQRKVRSRGRVRWIVAPLIAVVVLFASIPAYAAIGASKVTEITTTSDLSSYSFPSATYSNNVLYICFTGTSYSSQTAPTVTSVSGAGLDFTEILPAGGLPYSSGYRRIQAWRALATGGATTGVVTVTLSGPTLPSAGMGAVIIAVTGTKTSGTNGADAIANYATAITSSTSLEVSMAAFADSNNRPLAFFGHRYNEATNNEAGYTELYEGIHTSVNMGYEAEWHETVADTTPSVTWANAGYGESGGIALEIAAEGGGVVNPCGTNLVMVVGTDAPSSSYDSAK
ncbi:MAG: hypothetical protein LJE87_08245, partial [Deltaproteobacteria bacterium]|nr:hypothetical protein [Deltaproteobacteria bacterium]